MHKAIFKKKSEFAASTLMKFTSNDPETGKNFVEISGRLKGTDDIDVQANLYNTDSWGVKEAKEHAGETISFKAQEEEEDEKESQEDEDEKEAQEDEEEDEEEEMQEDDEEEDEEESQEEEDDEEKKAEFQEKLVAEIVNGGLRRRAEQDQERASKTEMRASGAMQKRNELIKK